MILPLKCYTSLICIIIITANREALAKDLTDRGPNLINNGTLIRLAKHLSDKVNREPYNNRTLIQLAKHLSDKVKKEDELNKKFLSLCDIDNLYNYVGYENEDLSYDEIDGYSYNNYNNENEGSDWIKQELQRLLIAGADINTTNTEGRTCLMNAAQVQLNEITKILLEKGAGTEIKDKNGDSALYLASINNYEEIEKLLLDHGATPLDGDRKQKVLNKKLITVCKNNSNFDLDELQRLIRAGADINTKDTKDETTSSTHHFGFLHNFNKKEVYNATCLMYTAGNGRYEATKMLIDQKSNLNLKNTDDMTALRVASEKGHIDVVKLLLKSGANTEIKDMNGMTALYVASEKGHIDVVRLLLESGANTEIKDWIGMTALYVASEKGHIDVVRLLLESGANTKIQDMYGDSPLKVASSFGYRKIGNLLLEHGATPLNDNENKKVQDMLNLQVRSLCLIDDDRFREYIICNPHSLSLENRIKASGSFCNAYDADDDMERFQRLLTAGADINTTSSDGRTCLMKAAFDGNFVRTKMLLENKAAIDIKDKNGGSALFYAAANEKIEKLLLKHGATPLDFNVKQKALNYELIALCRWINREIHRDELLTILKDGPDTKKNPWGHRIIEEEAELQRLLRAGADINIRDFGSGGRTCLMKAVQQQNFDIVSLMLENGADPEVKDDAGDSPLDKTSGNKNIENLLLKHGASSQG